MANGIYFDNAATTALDSQVFDAMRPYLCECHGNPSSLHWAGREARAAVEEARSEVASLLNARAEEIVFTASGTESDNMALSGLVQSYKADDCHIITTAFEHPAILETCRYLVKRGYEVSLLPVGGDGLVDPETLKKELRQNTRLVSVMAANNVVGTVQPITELAGIAHEYGALFHTDAVQAVGKIPLNVKAAGIDLLSLSAHKLHGPKGVGALFVRSGVQLEPLIRGGGQERGLRSATENLAGIVGLSCAARIACTTLTRTNMELVRLRDKIIDGVKERIPNAYLIGDRYRRLPGHVCLGFSGQEGEAIKLLLALDEAGIAVSTGSACSAHKANEPSYVLSAMGLDALRARGGLRITLSRLNTEGEVDHFLEILPKLVGTMRSVSSRAPHKFIGFQRGEHHEYARD